MPDPTGWVSHEPIFHRGVSWKQPVRVASTGNVALATAVENGDTIDGVVLATGDRVLLKDQTSGIENGIYEVQASGPPLRAFDMDQDATFLVPASEVIGAVVLVTSGTANAGTLWRNTNTTLPVLGTDALTFGQILTTTNISALTAAVFGYLAHGNTGSTETFDASLAGWHSATLDSATVTVTLTGATSGEAWGMVLELLQDGTGGRLVSWPGSVVWPGGTAPTLSTAAGATDLILLQTRDGGTTWYGFMAGGGGSALTIKDEGSSLATAATSIDFVGAGVTASGAGAAKTVTIAGGIGEILISDTPSTPLVFADLLQNDDQTDLLYGDP